MRNKLTEIKKRALDEIKNSGVLDELERINKKYLGRKGELTKTMKTLREVAEKERPAMGQLVNQTKQEIQKILKETQKRLASENEPDVQKMFDATIPGTNQNTGNLHPITQVKLELDDAFKSLGFKIYEGPEISSEGYCFDVLNFPQDHPARESMDTYWIEQKKDKNGLEKLCLRPHLTGGSVRFMQAQKPPFQIVYPGRVFRSEATDAGHERTFYQYEALIVNKDITFSGGKILVKAILDRVFKRDVKTRMRSGFFPFVEPGFEIDMQCLNCNGKGCSVCGDGWVEMMPGGPPHPNVLKAGGIDPEKWQGFYINVGLDRLTMMKYKIDDIRLFHSGDLRFLKQF